MKKLFIILFLTLLAHTVNAQPAISSTIALTPMGSGTPGGSVIVNWTVQVNNLSNFTSSTQTYYIYFSGVLVKTASILPGITSSETISGKTTITIPDSTTPGPMPYKESTRTSTSPIESDDSNTVTGLVATGYIDVQPAVKEIKKQNNN